MANFLSTCLAACLASGSTVQESARPIDVLSYGVEVAVLADHLELEVSIHARMDDVPGEWELELAESMRVLSVAEDGRVIPFRQAGGRLVLDLSETPADATELDIDIALEGTPFNRFSERRGGFVRTKVDAEIAYIRSQYPWYPRAANDPATYRTVIDSPRAWTVQTAGRLAGVEESGERKIWTFEENHPSRRIGLIAGPYRVIEPEAGGSIELTALVLGDHEESARALLAVAGSALAYYAERFGPLTGEDFTIVEMPEEYGTGSGYGESGYVLIGAGAFASADPAPWAREMVAHEVAHAWWGRTVEFANFASEALAEYATLGFVEAVDGADRARGVRAKAVEAVLSAAADGREVALGDIRSFGQGMDPGTYRVHAYEKGMLLLAMLESVEGQEALDGVLSEFLSEKAGDLVTWTDLRKALRGASSAARAVVDQWEVPGIPTLALDVEVEPSGRAWRVEGTLSQAGTQKPFRMEVTLVAICAGERVEETVTLRGKKVKVRFKVPSKPERVLVDPDFRLLVGRPRAAAMAIDAAIERAHEVVGSPGVTDVKRCEGTIELLRGILDSGPGDHEGYCHTGIGRCLFRLGRFEEATTAFETALRFGAGGPFHRGWVHLRLGNIADVEGRRKDALEHYQKAQAPGASKAAAADAAKFVNRPYRQTAPRHVYLPALKRLRGTATSH